MSLTPLADRPRTLSGLPTAVLLADTPIIITIDGPAGTGKSSVARTLARRLGLDFLDTGAMYRAAAALVIDDRIPRDDHERIVRRVERADISFDWRADPPTILADGHPMDRRVREADVTAVVSPIASIGGLRRLMVAKQRGIGRVHPRLVSEGRDQGSVVFPDAELKFYLDASPHVRAARRADQLTGVGERVEMAALLSEIIERDRSDSSRADGPLTCPASAIRVDTSELTFEEVVDTLESHVRSRLPMR